MFVVVISKSTGLKPVYSVRVPVTGPEKGLENVYIPGSKSFAPKSPINFPVIFSPVAKARPKRLNPVEKLPVTNLSGLT